MGTLYRDITGHPAAERMCEPYAALRRDYLQDGSVSLGVMDYFTGARRSVVEVHLDPDRTTMIIFWPFFDHPVVSLKTVLSDGTIVETQADPKGPGLLKRLMHQADHRRAGLVEQYLSESVPAATWQAHRVLVDEAAASLGATMKPIRSMRAYLAGLERANEVHDRAISLGMVACWLPAIVLGRFLVAQSQEAGEGSRGTAYWACFGVLGLACFLLIPFARRLAARLPLWKKVPAADILGEPS